MSGKDSSAADYAKIILAVIVVMGFLWWKTDNIRSKEIKRQQEQIEMYQSEIMDMTYYIDTIEIFLSSVREDYEDDASFEDADYALYSLSRQIDKLCSDM